MAESNNFGIDLLFASQNKNIESKNDVLVILMHWMLCKNNLRNVGLGDNKVYSEEDRGSELLPEGWNANRTSYTLRYSINKEIFLLHGVVMDTSLLINLLDATTLETHSLVFDVSKAVKSTKGVTLDDFVCDGEALIKRIKDEIVQPMLNKFEKKNTPTEERSSLLVDEPRRPNRQPAFRNDPDPFYQPDPFDVRNIGRGDLDPLGRGGGGMIFRPEMPFRPGGFGPRGPMPPFGLPPGARFDPPNPFGRMNPDPDHLPPPGRNPPDGYDDMFM